MDKLVLLSLSRQNLPVFEGATNIDRLRAARDAALAVLLKYKPTLSYDVDAATSIMNQVSVWEERNSAALQAIFADPSATSLPEQVRLAFGNDKAQAFILAGFTQAAIGLGPWFSGAVDRAAEAAKPGDTIQRRWADDDALARVNIFASIVKMDTDGYLDKLFIHPQDLSGLGFVPIAIEGATLVWALVVTIVSVAAILVGYLYMTKSVEQNNRLMRDLCDKAQRDGDTATVELCIKEAAGLQKSVSDSVVRMVGQVATILGLTYLGFKLFPKLLHRGSAKGSR